MKYEEVFGDQGLFEGMMPDCEFVDGNYGYKNNRGIFYYCERYNEKFGWVFSHKTNLEFRPIAMRRIIKTPKRWTWEDKKAGRLPDVGCNVSSAAYGYVCSVVAIDSNSRHVWCQFPDQSVGSCMIFEINPIETPAEKAQREEDEFINSMLVKGVVYMTDYIEGIRAAYRKLKGGE